jgi:ubiquinone/menaquinone biosynthesis C-methylase UbiE
MEPPIDIERALGIQELRARFLQHTKRAYMMLPTFERPRILDIGCGTGLPTMVLAELGLGEIVGIDTEDAALSQLQQRIEHANLSHRVVAINASLYETGIPDQSFDILWTEGVLHLLDPCRSFRECHRLLKPKRFLMIHETIAWFQKRRETLPGFGFEYVDRYLLPRHCWWTDYGAPLEERIRAMREAHGGAAESGEFTRYEQEVASLKEAPGRFDSGFFLIKKRDYFGGAG